MVGSLISLINCTGKGLANASETDEGDLDQSAHQEIKEGKTDEK